MNPLIPISIVWIISEIVLARVKISSSEAQDKDKFSLRVLWITIILSIISGNLVRKLDVGFINIYSEFVHYFGLFLILAGLSIRWVAILKLKSMFTVDVSIQENHYIVKSGIYKIIRHPAYLGSLLSFLGLGIAFVNLLSIIIIFIPILISFIYRIHIEEKVLIAEFGEEYLKYSNSTNRFFPGIY